MRAPGRLAVLSLVSAALAAGTAAASYERHPELHPSVRCAAIGASSPHCQPLFWDLAPAVYVGQRVAAEPDPATGFPAGRTDRPPPLWVEDASGDGRLGPEDEALGAAGYEERQEVAGRLPMCPLGIDAATGDVSGVADFTVRDPDLVPWWRPVAGEPGVFEVACRRGTRAYFGPWWVGTAPGDFDAVAFKVMQFENAQRLMRDGLAPNEAREWNTGIEVYTHVGAHHATCDVSASRCNDANDPEYANSTACDAYRDIAEQCPAESDGLGCAAAQDTHDFVVFRTTSARQGRFLFELPEDRGFPTVEDPLWFCQNHVVNDEPYYGGVSSDKRDFRRQEGGAVGELVIQMFTEPWAAGKGSVNTVFDFVFQRMTTFIPPFTIAPQSTVWYAPFDLALGMATTHSHENMVKGTMQIVPAPRPRPGSARAECGGGTGNPDVYTSYDYFEPTVCEYWREPDGPIILRKGDAVVTSCIVNNGVTHTDRIEDPALRAAVENSPAGQELLYGRQGPEAYRVRYGCEETFGVPPGVPPAVFPVANRFRALRECPANPATDEEGRPVDEAYPAEEFCPTGLGYTGRCAPASVIFRNTGEDAMCIPILMYWPLDRLVGSDGTVDEEALEKLQAGETDEVGAPGRLWQSPSDAGQCDDGSDGSGVDDPGVFSTTQSRNCKAGL